MEAGGYWDGIETVYVYTTVQRYGDKKEGKSSGQKGGTPPPPTTVQYLYILQATNWQIAEPFQHLQKEKAVEKEVLEQF
jgi:hypothetical protein